MADNPPFRTTPEGLTLNIRVTPNAGPDRIEGLETRSDGTAVLRIRLSAVPEKGKANAALIALLAKSLNVSKSSIRIAIGETGRLKVVEITGPGAILAGRLTDILAG